MLETAYALKLTAQKLGNKLLPEEKPNKLGPDRVKDFVNKVKRVDETAGAQVQKAFKSMTYIDIPTLLQKFEHMLDLLMKHAKKANIVYCIAINDVNEKMKSDVWLALRACQDVHFHFTYADAKPWANISAFQELGMPVEVITFDDVMYSGAQVLATIRGLRAQYARSYACVPYIHAPDQIQKCVHPVLQDTVTKNSKGLLRAETILDPKIFGNSIYDSTLTYLQMKHPDNWSLPQFLLTGDNPFSKRYSPELYHRYAEDVGLIPDCDGLDKGYCPYGAYKSIVLPRTSFPTTRKLMSHHDELEKHILSTVVGDPPCLFMDTPLINGRPGIVFDFSSKRIVEAAKRLGVDMPVTLPPTVAVKIGRPGLQGKGSRLEATAFRRLQGIEGVPMYYGCVTYGELPLEVRNPKTPAQNFQLFTLLQDFSDYLTLPEVDPGRDMSWLYEYLLTYLDNIHNNGVFLMSLIPEDVYIHPTQNTALVARLDMCAIMSLHENPIRYHVEYSNPALDEWSAPEFWLNYQVADWSLVKRVCKMPNGRQPFMPEVITYKATEYQRLQQEFRDYEERERLSNLTPEELALEQAAAAATAAATASSSALPGGHRRRRSRSRKTTHTRSKRTTARTPRRRAPTTRRRRARR